jgi:transposase
LRDTVGIRIGKKKAALAIAHKILVIVYHLLALGTSYETRYDQWNPRQEAGERQRAIKALERLGYTVTVERAA